MEMYMVIVGFHSFTSFIAVLTLSLLILLFMSTAVLKLSYELESYAIVIYLLIHCDNQPICIVIDCWSKPEETHANPCRTNNMAFACHFTLATLRYLFHFLHFCSSFLCLCTLVSNEVSNVAINPDSKQSSGSNPWPWSCEAAITRSAVIQAHDVICTQSAEVYIS